MDEGHQTLIRCKGKKLTFADPLTGNLAETATVKPWQLKAGAVRHRTQGEGGNPLRFEGLTFGCPLTGDSAAWSQQGCHHASKSGADSTAPWDKGISPSSTKKLQAQTEGPGPGYSAH